MDRLTSMGVFVTVVDTGGFTAASRKLHISRAGASKHVMDLEAYLGARLLHRTTRRISLTDIGKVYYERCQSILADVAEADACAGATSSEPRGRLRVNAPTSFGIAHLGPAVAAYCQQYSKAQVSLELNDRTVDVVAEGYDLAIRIAALADSSLIARKIAPCRRVFCAAPDYLRRHGEPGVPQDLAVHQCLVYENLPTGNTWTLYGPTGMETVPVNGPVCANNGEILRAAAVEGLGITLLPTFMASSELRDGRLVVVLPEYRAPEVAIYTVFPSRRYLSATVRTFVDYLAEYFGDNPSWDS